MTYHSNSSPRELNQKLLFGIKKHLLIAQQTSYAKPARLQSINNIIEVLEFVLSNLNTELNQEEIVLYERFFNMLLLKLVKAKIMIHLEPMNFLDEIGFINILLKF